ncbi:hypothetical protein CLOP_g24239 [Closterium sp. NIES-67]|nr:hypothetical protein CLOP_g24239 [Closterium sp. NIES-67]
MHLLPETDCGPKAWAVLKDLHAPTSVAASLMLDRELSMLRLSENEPGLRGDRVLWDLHESRDVLRSMWQIPALIWESTKKEVGAVKAGSGVQGECNAEEAVKGLKLSGQPNDTKCETCLLSKFTRFPFHGVAGKSKAALELVHMDLVGPFSQGKKGERYFLTIVDDWSRLMWVYPLKQKDHAASTIRDDWLPAGNSMWPHAVRHATVARNRVLIKVADDMWVPLERWLGKKPPQQQEASKTPSLPKRRKQIGGGTKDWVKAIQCKWLAKIKTDEKGEPSVYKSRLVAKGFQQKEKEDYKEVFAPTAKSPTLRVLLAVAAVRKWKMKQMDIRRRNKPTV